MDRSLPVARAMASATAKTPPGRRRVAFVAVAAAYLATVWLDAVGSSLPEKLTPRVWLYFSQIAALFKNAGMMAISYRAEGWSCAEQRWIELDTRPWFRIEAENKENRFHRTLQFYRGERKVMRALEDYVLRRANEGASSTIGGVRFLSLRVPYPAVGEHVERTVRRPLSSYPEDQRHAWYWTPESKRRERCGGRAP